MHYDQILLRLGELTLKGKNRSRFEDRVVSDLQARLKPFARLKLSKTYGRLYIELNGEDYRAVMEQLQKVFGIGSFSPVRRTELDLRQIQELALTTMRQLHRPAKTFKVSAKRAYKAFPHDSQELNHLVGAYVLRHTPELKVDVHKPEIELRVEIREEGAFVYCEVVPGQGGYPLGSSGKAMLMLSGGIDSPVAGYLALRKGLRLEAVHFHSMPYTSEKAKMKVIDLTRTLAEYGKRIPLHLVPFTDIQTRLKQESEENLLITMMRRAMFRITEQLALRRNAGAIVTGESLGQVASQTLPSLQAIGEVVKLPLLRPLITMDKQEIIAVSEKIDTYPISILPYEDCCTLFVPKSPSTNPNLRIIARMEERMEWLPEWIERAVEDTEVVLLSRENKTDEFESLL